jgi:ribosomal protein L19
MKKLLKNLAFTYNFFFLSIEKPFLHIGSKIFIKYFHNQGYFFSAQGRIIALKNKGYHKTITLRQDIQHIYVDHVFQIVSPNTISIFIKEDQKFRRSKLYFLK